MNGNFYIFKIGVTKKSWKIQSTSHPKRRGRGSQFSTEIDQPVSHKNFIGSTQEIASYYLRHLAINRNLVDNVNNTVILYCIQSYIIISAVSVIHSYTCLSYQLCIIQSLSTIASASERTLTIIHGMHVKKKKKNKSFKTIKVFVVVVCDVDLPTRLVCRSRVSTVWREYRVYVYISIL